MGMNTNSTTVSNPSANLDVAAIAEVLESILINGERITLPDFASAVGISTSKAKESLTKHYGTRVQFRRGRKGGIYLHSDGGDNTAPISEPDMNSEEEESSNF
jgi:hypothetical protein